MEQLSAQIAAHPNDAALYLRRGDLWRDHGAWGAALADFDSAAALEPDHPRLEYLRARTLEEAGWHQMALFVIDRHLARFANDGPAHLVRAHALVGLKDYLQAAEAYRAALAGLERPQPDHYLEWADALRLAGGEHVAEAVDCLDEGMRRLGPIVTLQRRAIDLETQLGRSDQALRRIDMVMSTLHRKETWLALRAQVLDQAGRTDEARAAYAASLAAIEKLPPRYREVPMMKDLRSQVRNALERLDDKHGVGVSANTAATTLTPAMEKD